MFYLRTTKTKSGATAVQIVRYENRKKIIIQHIGSAHNKEELTKLLQAGSLWVEKKAKQPPLFKQESSSQVLTLDKCKYLGFRYSLLYEVLSKLFVIFKYHLLHNKLLTDLVIARIASPSSKLQALEFLEKFVGSKYKERDLYRQMSAFHNLQSVVENKVLKVAKDEFNFNFTLVFYDVTTLYFESFTADELRKPGFSKDNKSQQPQIVIGLLVNQQGFPIAYHVFEGNKFEGKTLIPVILDFKTKHDIKTFTVVADAAMISFDNITALKQNGLQYIVAARTGSLSPKLITEVSLELNQQDKTTVRKKTAYGDLILEFSVKRFAKDKREMEKQVARAEYYLADKSKIKKAKFIKAGKNTKYELNNVLLEKTEQLLGIKGYYTNLEPEVTDRMIIDHYHNLWHVEQAFRIAKSDLQMRPIYHFKDTTIKAHILICFMALAVCKYMELKTGKSTKHIVNLLKSVTDARLINTLNNQEFTLRSPIDEETKGILQQLAAWY